jgi:hypothetical protein
MRALVVTVCICALLASAARSARAQVVRANRFPMPRLALSLALDWKSVFARERRQAMSVQMRAPTPLRHQQMLGGGLVLKAPPAPLVVAYDRLQGTLLRVVQPRRELTTADAGGQYVRAVSGGPMFGRGGVGAQITFETSPRF